MAESPFEPAPDVLYHGTREPGTLLELGTFDRSRLQARDLGYFGRGFYTATTKKHASNYGHRVLSVRLRPGSQLLNGMAGTVPTPQTLNPVRQPSYHEAFRTFVPLLAPIDRHDRVLREFDDLYDPEQPDFDSTRLVQACHRVGREERRGCGRPMGSRGGTHGPSGDRERVEREPPATRCDGVAVTALLRRRWAVAPKLADRR